MTIKEPTRTIVSVGRCWLSREAPFAWFSTKFLSKWDVELLLLSRLGRRPESVWCPSRLGTNSWWWLWSSEPPLLSNFSWSFWKKEPKLYIPSAICKYVVRPIFSSFGSWCFGHFSCVIFFFPSCLAKSKQRLRDIFVFLWLNRQKCPKTKKEKWDDLNVFAYFRTRNYHLVSIFTT